MLRSLYTGQNSSPTNPSGLDGSPLLSFKIDKEFTQYSLKSFFSDAEIICEGNYNLTRAAYILWQHGLRSEPNINDRL